MRPLYDAYLFVVACLIVISSFLWVLGAAGVDGRRWRPALRWAALIAVLALPGIIAWLLVLAPTPCDTQSCQ
jgi:hypothetical protein